MLSSNLNFCFKYSANKTLQRSSFFWERESFSWDRPSSHQCKVICHLETFFSQVFGLKCDLMGHKVAVHLKIKAFQVIGLNGNLGPNAYSIKYFCP